MEINMKILFILGVMYPQPSNNSNLALKIIPALTKNHDVHILAAASGGAELLPDCINNIPIHWIQDSKSVLKNRFLFPVANKLKDKNGFSDAGRSMLLSENLIRVRKEFPYDAVIATMEPFVNGISLVSLPINIKKIIYLMDPPAAVIKESSGLRYDSKYRSRMLPGIIKKADLILTTHAISAALQECGYCHTNSKIEEVGFPMIQEMIPIKTQSDIPMNPDKINLLFCGTLYAKIRSPEFFLKIVERLDEHFCVYFMGWDCDKLKDKYPIQSKADIVCLPRQDYQVALNAMQSADILINIGNSVSVHMPSKLLEYFNTGKPIVNIVKLDDCPSLYYTSRYPRCLEIRENEETLNESVAQFIDYCASSKGLVALKHSEIEKLFPECTPEMIAGKIQAAIQG